MKKAIYIVTRPLIWLITGLVAIVFFMASRRYMEQHRKRHKAFRKMKYFKPTIHDGFFGESVSWELRDKPLSDQQLNEIIK